MRRHPPRLAGWDFDQLELVGTYLRRPHPDDLDGIPPVEAENVAAVLVSAADDGDTRVRGLILAVQEDLE